MNEPSLPWDPIGSERDGWRSLLTIDSFHGKRYRHFSGVKNTLTQILFTLLSPFLTKKVKNIIMFHLFLPWSFMKLQPVCWFFRRNHPLPTGEKAPKTEELSLHVTATRRHQVPPPTWVWWQPRRRNMDPMTRPSWFLRPNGGWHRIDHLDRWRVRILTKLRMRLWYFSY